MDENNRLLYFVLMDDTGFEVALMVIHFWRQQNSHLRTWLLRKRLCLQRIHEERRIGIENYYHDFLPRYHNVQFKEHFRMARATFEVYIGIVSVNYKRAFLYFITVIGFVD